MEIERCISFTQDELECLTRIVLDKYNRESNHERFHGIKMDSSLKTIKDKVLLVYMENDDEFYNN